MATLFLLNSSFSAAAAVTAVVEVGDVVGRVGWT